MYEVETVKGRLERFTGLARPSTRKARSLIKKRKAQPKRFADAKPVPNNPALPFILYRGAVSLGDSEDDPAAVFECIFESNGWVGSWRNGIYDYEHYHPRTHEVLGIARGTARVRFGGKTGKSYRLKAGDVVILPADTGHKALEASDDLLVVGAYPRSGKYDEYKATPAKRVRAMAMIPKVRPPGKDPVYGKDGPMTRLWNRARRAA